MNTWAIAAIFVLLGYIALRLKWHGFLLNDLQGRFIKMQDEIVAMRGDTGDDIPNRLSAIESEIQELSSRFDQHYGEDDGLGLGDLDTPPHS